MFRRVPAPEGWVCALPHSGRFVLLRLLDYGRFQLVSRLKVVILDAITAVFFAGLFSKTTPSWLTMKVITLLAEMRHSNSNRDTTRCMKRVSTASTGAITDGEQRHRFVRNCKRVAWAEL
jgi:hypothetical protein